MEIGIQAGTATTENLRTTRSLLFGLADVGAGVRCMGMGLRGPARSLKGLGSCHVHKGSKDSGRHNLGVQNI